MQLEALGVRQGDLLLVHTSFRAIRPIDGGPERLIHALLRAIGPSGTLVMPTMTDGASQFDPKTTPTVDMGVVAETFWRMPAVVRSTHPGGSFAAFGPLAREICAEQPLEPPHGIESPPGRVYALGGKVLLLGVDHSESTVMHVAESIAGVPYSIAYPTVVGDDVVSIRETDSCCRGFCKVDAWIPIHRGKVGNADAKLYEARAAVDACIMQLRTNPLLFLCEPGACEDCDAAHASIKR